MRDEAGQVVGPDRPPVHGHGERGLVDDAAVGERSGARRLRRVVEELADACFEAGRRREEHDARALAEGTAEDTLDALGRCVESGGDAEDLLRRDARLDAEVGADGSDGGERNARLAADGRSGWDVEAELWKEPLAGAQVGVVEAEASPRYMKRSASTASPPIPIARRRTLMAGNSGSGPPPEREARSSSMRGGRPTANAGRPA